MPVESKKYNTRIGSSELIAACEQKGFPCFATPYLENRSDYILFNFIHEDVQASVLYCPLNGRANGHYTTLDYQLVKYSTDDKLDGTPWFDALLEFIHPCG